MNQKCYNFAQPCKYDDKLNIINENQCPAVPTCIGENAEIFRKGENCCCDYKSVSVEERKPYLGLAAERSPEPSTVPTCESDAELNITGGFLQVCPDYNECTGNNALVLEMLEDVSKIGKCCCARPQISDGLKFLSM